MTRPNNYRNIIQVTPSNTDENKYILSTKDHIRTTMVNFNETFIFGIVTDPKFKTSHTYDICSTTFTQIRGILKVKLELFY